MYLVTKYDDLKIRVYRREHRKKWRALRDCLKQVYRLKRGENVVIERRMRP